MDLEHLVKQILGQDFHEPQEVHRKFASDYAPMLYRIASNFPGGRCTLDSQEELEQDMLRRISRLKPERVNRWARDYLMTFMIYVMLDEVGEIDPPNISFSDLFIMAMEASGQADNDMLASSDWNQNIMVCSVTFPKKGHSQNQLTEILVRVSDLMHDAVLRSLTPEQKDYYDRAVLEMANEVDGLPLDID